MTSTQPRFRSVQGLVEKGHPDRDGYDFHRHAEPVAPSEPAAFLRGGHVARGTTAPEYHQLRYEGGNSEESKKRGDADRQRAGIEQD